MNQINFLPQSIVQQSARRRERMRYVALMILLAPCLLGWAVREHSVNTSYRHEAEDYESQVQAAREQMSEVVKLKAEREVLVKQNSLRQELSQTISHTQTFKQISELLPASVTLQEVRMVTKRPPPDPLVDPDARKRRSRKKQKEVVPDNELTITLEGIAPDDLTIANIIGDLSDYPLFDRVFLEYTRNIETQGFQARAFRLTLRMRLDRRIELEVADAG